MCRDERYARNNKRYERSIIRYEYKRRGEEMRGEKDNSASASSATEY